MPDSCHQLKQLITSGDTFVFAFVERRIEVSSCASRVRSRVAALGHRHR